MRVGISQEEAGRRVGVTLRTYARWERGESLGFIGHIAEIAKALETTSDELVGGDRQILAPSVEELSLKLDAVMNELRELRQDLAPTTVPSRRRK